MVRRDIQEFFIVVRRESFLDEILLSFFVQRMMYGGKRIFNFFCKIVKAYESFLAVVTAYQYTLVFLNVFWADFQTQRDAFHFVFAEFPSRRII